MTGLEWLDGVEAPVFVLTPADTRARIVFWNRAAERLTGLGRAQALGRRVADVLGTAALHLPAPGEAGPVAAGTIGAASLRPIPGRDVLVVTLPAQAEDAERELFLGMAAHDLRAPLRNILHLCEDAACDPDAPRRIAAIATRAQELLSDILTAVQASTAPSGPRSPVDLGAFCRVLFAMLDPGGRHDLKADEAILEVERPVLQIVLRNLVDNAIRHGGAARLSLRVGAEGHPGGQIALRVSDDGRGFDDPATSFLGGGEMRRDSGFGLVGLRRLIRARGGTLSVARADHGSGSVVTVTLPGAILSSEGAVARAS